MTKWVIVDRPECLGHEISRSRRVVGQMSSDVPGIGALTDLSAQLAASNLVPQQSRWCEALTELRVQMLGDD